jgi:acetolactate synthase-1/2/3 large subunit
MLTRLNGLVPAVKHPAWRASIDALKVRIPAVRENKGMEPRAIFEAIHDAFGDDAVITTEVGQHQMWTAQFYPFTKPRSFLSSCGLGTMGYGTGAAIGAQVARPDTRVVHVAGDGSFRMNLTELATIFTYNLPITIVVINNGTLGMVRQWQSTFYERRYSHTTLDRPPDFVKLADAYGIRAFRPTCIEELRKNLLEAAAAQEPTLIDCRIDIDENVYPFVPPGKGLDEQITESAD